MPNKFFPLFANKKQDPQTIHLPLTAFVRVKAVPIAAAGTSVVITPQLTTALKTAARNGQEVPLQKSANEEGRGVAVGGEIISIYSSTTQRKLDVGGIEVYGLLSEAAGVYTVTFKQVGTTGAIADVSVPIQNIDLEIPYRFDLHELPSNAITGLNTRNVFEEILSLFGIAQEELTTTAKNTIPALSQTPATNGAIWVEYRGFMFSNGAGAAVLSVNTATRTLTFDPAKAGFDIPDGELLTVYYTTA